VRQCGQASPPGAAPPRTAAAPRTTGSKTRTAAASATTNAPASGCISASRQWRHKRIEAMAATIEAEWAEQAGARGLQELRTTLSDLLTPRQGR